MILYDMGMLWYIVLRSEITYSFDAHPDDITLHVIILHMGISSVTIVFSTLLFIRIGVVAYACAGFLCFH